MFSPPSLPFSVNLNFKFSSFFVCVSFFLSSSHTAANRQTDDETTILPGGLCLHHHIQSHLNLNITLSSISLQPSTRDRTTAKSLNIECKGVSCLCFNSTAEFVTVISDDDRRGNNKQPLFTLHLQTDKYLQSQQVKNHCKC